MRLPGPAERHLTYCTNIHPGESWAEIRDNLERYLPPVRERVAPGAPFGVGLRLSGAAARELGERARLDELAGLLRAHDLYVFTINGFPYGPFHGQPVKQQVYRPDWLEPERLAYTNALADVLAALLPEHLEGTISTVPGAFAPRVRDPGAARRMATAMASHAAHLVRLREAAGRRVALALEPEPCCHLETIAQTVEFFEHHLLSAEALAVVQREAGLSRADAEAALRGHVGVCLDTCHLAVEFEDPAAAVGALTRAGIRIAKTQVSAGLRIRLSGGADPALAALRDFADDVYLHQVVERRADGGLRRYLDLPDALAAAARAPEGEREWRVHFHVPLFHPRLGHFESTRDHVAETLAVLLRASDCPHFEVETYTWDVLPAAFRRDDLVTAVARELEWAAGELRRGPQVADLPEG